MKRMFVRVLWLSGLLAARPLAAQTVIRPAPPLDSARAELRDAVLVLRDSLVTVDGAAARFQRDNQAASGPVLLSRARSMYDACARSGRTVPPTRTVVQNLTVTEPLKVKRRQDMVAALDQLTNSLGTCQSEFAAMSKPGQAERVRGYANDRAVRIQASIRNYERVLRDFLSIMGIRVLPLGVSSSPS